MPLVRLQEENLGGLGNKTSGKAASDSGSPVKNGTPKGKANGTNSKNTPSKKCKAEEMEGSDDVEEEDGDGDGEGQELKKGKKGANGKAKAVRKPKTVKKVEPEENADEEVEEEVETFSTAGGEEQSESDELEEA
jgi:hypothetical protein